MITLGVNCGNLSGSRPPRSPQTLPSNRHRTPPPPGAFRALFGAHPARPVYFVFFASSIGIDPARVSHDARICTVQMAYTRLGVHAPLEYICVLLNLILVYPRSLAYRAQLGRSAHQVARLHQERLRALAGARLRTPRRAHLRQVCGPRVTRLLTPKVHEELPRSSFYLGKLELGPTQDPRGEVGGPLR